MQKVQRAARGAGAVAVVAEHHWAQEAGAEGQKGHPQNDQVAAVAGRSERFDWEGRQEAEGLVAARQNDQEVVAAAGLEVLRLGVPVEELAVEEEAYKSVRWDCPNPQRIRWNQYYFPDFFGGQEGLAVSSSHVGLVEVGEHSEREIL